MKGVAKTDVQITIEANIGDQCKNMKADLTKEYGVWKGAFSNEWPATGTMVYANTESQDWCSC